MPRLLDMLADFAKTYDLAIEMADDEGLIPKELVERLKTVEGELDDKIRSYGALILSLEVDMNAFAQYAARLDKKAKAIEATIGHLKETVKAVMIEAGKTKVVGIPTVSVCRNSQPSVVVKDEAAIPRKFFITPPMPEPALSRTAILAAHKAEEIVPGVDIVQGTHVRVK